MSQAVIISIGTEMLTGARIDTNSAWLSDQLNALGIETRLHITVGDDVEKQVEILRDVIPDCELILMTGGLGPTLDDLTREVLAKVLNTSMYTDEASLKQIREMFEKRGRIMPERNLSQARFPVGSLPIPNPIGTAPGIYLEVPQLAGLKKICRIAAMPGVPSEMKKMFLEQVVPKLPATGQVIKLSTVECFGVGESQCEELLGDLTARGRDPEVGITVHQATISLRIVAKGETSEICQQKITATKKIIHQRLDSLVYGEEGISLEEVVLVGLKQKQLKLATCEVGCAGGLSSRITAAKLANSPYRGGMVAALPETQLQDDMGLQEILEAYSKTLLLDCHERFSANVVLLTVIPAGPSQRQALVGLLTYDLMQQQRIFLQASPLFDDETLNSARTAKAALNLVRLHLARM
jgi:nicotinamide-nucleotide amidase